MYLRPTTSAILALLITVVRANLHIKTLIFDNANDTVMIEFSEPVVVENVFLMEKTEQEDICVPVTSLNSDIVFPKKYDDKVEKLKKTDSEDKKYEKVKSNAETNRMEITLNKDTFNDKSVYLFKVNLFDEDDEIHSEEFVYGKEDGFEHKSSNDNNRWYSNPWPWVAISFIILALLLLLKIVCC